MDRIDKFLSTPAEEPAPTGRTSRSSGKKNLNKRKTITAPIQSQDIVEESNGKKKKIFANPESNKAISVGSKTPRKTRTSIKNK